MNSNFVDYVKVYVRSGKGGAGSAHLLRVKYNAKAGPDGGDGGRGGTSFCVATPNAGHSCTSSTPSTSLLKTDKTVAII